MQILFDAEAKIGHGIGVLADTTGTYSAVILRAAKGKRLAKLYRDPGQPPEPYDAGSYFRAREIHCGTFREFCDTLADLRPDECLIRGGIRDGARPDIEDGCKVRRLAHDRDDCLAAFEPADRNWIVLDLDDSEHPIDPSVAQLSIEMWREALPSRIQCSLSTFFFSASSHTSDRLRGKLVVALDRPMSCDEASALAESWGFDGSVCRAVQPNYFAPPVFAGCEDPIPELRRPYHFDGTPAVIPRSAATAAPEVAVVPDPTPALESISDRVYDLAGAMLERWQGGDRVRSNAWLHLAAWLLARGWDRAELRDLLGLIDDGEPAAKVREHRHILESARPNEGPGGARDWLGTDFEAIDHIANYDPIAEAILARTEQRVRETMRAAREAIDSDWDRDTDWNDEDDPLEYRCEGLRIAPSLGKVTVIAGNAGGGKGPIADHLAVCLATGRDAFGRHPCVASNVLIVDYEGARLTRRRILRMARSMGVRPADLAGRLHHVDVSRTGPALDADNLLALKRRIDRDAIDVVILDSYTTAMLGCDIESNSPQYAQLAQQLARLDVTVIVVAHAAKAHAREGMPRLMDIAGSGALGALAQTAIMVHYTDDSDHNRATVSCARAPETRFPTFDVVWADGADGSLSVTATDCAEKPASRKESTAIAQLSTDAAEVVRAIRVVDSSGVGVEPTIIARGSLLPRARILCGLAEAQRLGDVVAVRNPVTGAASWRLTPTALARVDTAIRTPS